MSLTLVVTVVVVVAVVAIVVMRFRNALPGAKRGDFFKVAIPRTLAPGQRLAVGTRLDIGAALKKDGENLATIKPLIDAGADEELLARYWARRDVRP